MAEIRLKCFHWQPLITSETTPQIRHKLTNPCPPMIGCSNFYTVNYSGFGGLGVACWPLVPKFAGSNPAEAVGFLRAKKSPKWRGSRLFGKITGQHSRPQFHLPPLGSLASWRRGDTWWRKWERLNVGENNGKLPLRTCPGCSVPEPYQSPDWALVSAQTGPRAEYL